MTTPNQTGLAKALAYSRERPVLVFLLLLGAVGGAVGGIAFAPEELSLLRRGAGGALAGILFAICALGFRLYD